MKKYIYMLALSVVFAACRSIDAVPQVYTCEVELPAAEGSLSFMVDTEGGWRVETSAPWLSLDRSSAEGKAAVTVTFKANMPQAAESCPSRTGIIALTKADRTSRLEIALNQFGLNTEFRSSGNEGVFSKGGFNIEYYLPAYEEVSAVYCSSDGLADKSSLEDWLYNSETLSDVDVRIMDKGIHQAGDIVFVFDTFDKEADLYARIRDFISGIPNDGRIVTGGTFWYKPVMEVGCENTPESYPASVSSAEFDADRYCWQNRWSDCIWLRYRDFTPTYNDEWRADYLYVNRDALPTVRDVAVLPRPIDGMLHNPLKIILTK